MVSPLKSVNRTVIGISIIVLIAGAGVDFLAPTYRDFALIAVGWAIGLVTDEVTGAPDRIKSEEHNRKQEVELTMLRAENVSLKTQYERRAAADTDAAFHLGFFLGGAQAFTDDPVRKLAYFNEPILGGQGKTADKLKASCDRLRIGLEHDELDTLEASVRTDLGETGVSSTVTPEEAVRLLSHLDYKISLALEPDADFFETYQIALSYGYVAQSIEGNRPIQPWWKKRVQFIRDAHVGANLQQGNHSTRYVLKRTLELMEPYEDKEVPSEDRQKLLEELERIYIGFKQRNRI